MLLILLGVAAATVLPVVAVNSSAIVAAQAVRYGIAQLDAGSRSLIVSYSSLELADSERTQVDTETRRQLATLTAAPVRAELLYHQLADSTGQPYELGGADNLGNAIRIISGRAPASCTPSRCEVVVVGDGTPSLDPSLGLVIVGRAVRTDPLVLTGTFDPGHATPLLLADNAASLGKLASLSAFQRAYGWVTSVDLDRVRHLGVTGYLARSAQVTEALAGYRGDLVLTAPDDVLRAQAARAQRSARRFTVLGGAATALLLGFAAVGAIGLRRDHLAVAALLRRRGAGRFAITLLTAIESAVPVLAGALFGLLAGAGVAALRCGAAGLPVASGAFSAVRGAAGVALFGTVAAGVVVAVTRAWPAGTAPRAAWRTLDATVLVGAAIVGLALGRGSVTAAALDQRADPLLLALPVIFVICGGLLVGRAWPYPVRALQRLIRHGRTGPRLGLLGALGRPLRPVATAAFLAAATGIVVFAGAYRATLAQGAADQAGYAVPLTATVRTGTSLDQPLAVADLPTFAGLVPGGSAYPVLRSSASVKISAVESRAAEIVGVDPAALSRVPAWNRLAGASDAATTARLLRPGTRTATATEQVGIPVPAGTTVLDFPAGGDLDQVQVTVWLRAADGRDVGLVLTRNGDHLVASPPKDSGDRIIALSMAESTDYATHEQHRIGEGGPTEQSLTGTVTLGAPTFASGNAVLPSPAGAHDWAGWTSTTSQVSTNGGQLKVAYQFTGARVVVSALVPATAAVPVLVDPDTASAAIGGNLQLVINGQAPLAARVVGVLPRFPTTTGHFVLADEEVLADQLDVREPGTGEPTEVWLSAPAGHASTLASRLAGAPYDRLALDLRQTRQDTLAGDPLARGASGLLDTDALLALLVAIVAVVLLVVAERRDESAELYAWESDGVAPGSLRASLFTRAAVVVAVAVPGGLLVGLALASVTTALVAVTAVGSTPTPPLSLAAGPAWVAELLGAGVALGLAAAAAVALTALRERLPRRPEPGQ
jgi:hypothetical protein